VRHDPRGTGRITLLPDFFLRSGGNRTGPSAASAAAMAASTCLVEQHALIGRDSAALLFPERPKNAL
jgi:hypothetical protein